MRKDDMEIALAFVQGIPGIGPVVGNQIVHYLRPNPMAKLIDQPRFLAVAAGRGWRGYSSMSPTMQRAVDCLQMWADLVHWTTSPIALGDVTRLTGIEWSDGPFGALDAFVGLGKRLHASVVPNAGVYERGSGGTAAGFRFEYDGPSMQRPIHGWFSHRILSLGFEPIFRRSTDTLLRHESFRANRRW